MPADPPANDTVITDPCVVQYTLDPESTSAKGEVCCVASAVGVPLRPTISLTVPAGPNKSVL